MLNKKILNRLSESNSKLILVTKYFSSDKTYEILQEAKKNNSFWALGENRTDSIIEKNIPRNFCHFIGNIQSRKIKEIAKNSSVIHSLCNIKHAELFLEQEYECDFFIQINISGESRKQGVLPENLEKFYKSLPKNINVIGVSGIGRSIFSKEEKIAEFQTLLNIREKYNSKWKISAGTSVDYQIALEMGIDIVRIGKSLFFI